MVFFATKVWVEKDEVLKPTRYIGPLLVYNTIIHDV